MDFLALAAAAAVMGAIVSGFLAFRQATVHPSSALERRLGSVLGATGFEVETGSEVLRQHKRSLPLFGGLIEGKSWAEQTAGRLERAEIRLTVSEFVALRVFAALILAALPLVLLGGAFGFLAALGAGVAGFQLPNLYVNMAASKRQKKLNDQLPEALTMLSNSLKAGFGLMQSLDLVSRELAHPMSTELRRVIQDVSVGMPRDEALQNMASRCGSADLDIVVTAMLIQQSTGGNLAEILDNVGYTMRERIRIRGEIKTLTTQQMMTGFIIGGLPIALLGIFSVVSPGYTSPLFTETIGNLLLVGAAVMEFIGVVIIKRILAIEV